jgi:hypothetical protein
VNDLHQFVGLIALNPGVLHQVTHPRDESTARRGLATHRDPMPPPKLDEPFVPQLPHRTKNRVGVHSENLGQIPNRRESFTRDGFAVRDGPANFSGDLFVEEGRVARVNLESRHGANEISTTGVEVQRLETEDQPGFTSAAIVDKIPLTKRPESSVE